ncbi:MAG: fluoride efflux transporter FluC [Verrucomicrobiia bacterium]
MQWSLAFGFCGGFTTFSSFSWQTLEQLRQGQMGVAMLYVVVSVLICVGATWLGWRLARG